MDRPELSIVVPTLNEEEVLPDLLQDLSRQQAVDFEVIVVDGGSADGTVAAAETAIERFALKGSVCTSMPGRGRQLNKGAVLASSDSLLFLHADSRLTFPQLLRAGLDALSSAPGPYVAGRFPLSFGRDSAVNFGYFFYEAKARLNRSGCIHGDQGFLLARTTFNHLEGFREDLPVMEDTFFANRLLREGEWLLLPGELQTSPRRFEVEGFKQRQTLNALLMNFLDIGWNDFLQTGPGIYRQQCRTGRLELKPFLLEIQRQLRALPLGQRLRLWYQTGRYVRANAWQLSFARLARKVHREHGRIEDIPMRRLERFDSWFDPLTSHWFGHGVTAVLVWLWFHFMLYVRTQ